MKLPSPTTLRKMTASVLAQRLANAERGSSATPQQQERFRLLEAERARRYGPR